MALTPEDGTRYRLSLNIGGNMEDARTAGGAPFIFDAQADRGEPMTFMLDELDPAKMAPARGRDIQPTEFGEGLGASTSQMMRDTNANFLRQRQLIGERDGLAARKIDIGLPMSEQARRLGPNGSKDILDAARAAQAASPDAWADLDLNEEGVEGRVTACLVQDDAGGQAILEMMHGGRGAAELLGGVVGSTVGVRNLPFLFLGGGDGSFIKVLGREAIWGEVAEAVTMPSQYEVAEERGKPAPRGTIRYVAQWQSRCRTRPGGIRCWPFSR